MDSFFNTYKRLPFTVSHGEGAYIYADDGTRYLDLFAGLAVNALGYGHKGILEAITEQSRRYIHLSNFFMQNPQYALAGKLTEVSGFDKVFFCNSGTEATEGALKIVRLWGKKNRKDECIGLSNSFHGRTYGALSLTDQKKYRDGFSPFLADCAIAGYNDIAGLKDAVSEKTAAVFIELIQGEGGVRPASPEFVKELAVLREELGFLIVADEIQTGCGRTGKLFAFEHFGFRPDILVLAKPIGGGLPLGAILGNEKVADILTPGMHGTTFGGNPLACAAGKVVLDELTDNGLLENARVIGERLKRGLTLLKDEMPSVIEDVRGYGLMLGAELTREGDSAVTALREEKKILLNCTAGNVLRFLPPLIITAEQADYAIECLRDVLNKLK